MPGHKSLLSIFDVSPKDVKERQCFGWLICLPNTPIIPSTSYVIFLLYYIYICVPVRKNVYVKCNTYMSYI